MSRFSHIGKRHGRSFGHRHVNESMLPVRGWSPGSRTQPYGQHELVDGPTWGYWHCEDPHPPLRLRLGFPYPQLVGSQLPGGPALVAGPRVAVGDGLCNETGEEIEVHILESTAVGCRNSSMVDWDCIVAASVDLQAASSVTADTAVPDSCRRRRTAEHDRGGHRPEASGPVSGSAKSAANRTAALPCFPRSEGQAGCVSGVV